MSRVLVRSPKSPFDVVDIEDALARDVMNSNTGNLIFSQAAHKLLSVPGTEVVSDSAAARPGLAARINAEYDAFVLPLANAFRPRFGPGLERLARQIRQLTVPAVVMGVGAQLPDGADFSALAGIDKEVRAFCSAVLDHSATIGVRGEVTADYLRRLGFRDVEVIGCPSLYMWGPDFRVDKGVPQLSADSPISVNGAHVAVHKLGLHHIIDCTYERYPHTRFVGQNTVEGRQLHWRQASGPVGAVTTIPTHPDHPLYRAGQVRVFIDPATWIDDLRGYDFSFGSRIHGNIAALLAGTPAVVLCADSRTLELCRYHEIPFRLLRETPPDIDPAELYDAADFTAFNEGHPERFDRFAGFLERNGLRDTFTHGDGGAAFDAALAELRLPPGIEPWNTTDVESLGRRLAWLQESNQALRDDNTRLQREVAKLRKARAAARPAGAVAPPVSDSSIGRIRRRLRRTRG